MVVPIVYNFIIVRFVYPFRDCYFAVYTDTLGRRKSTAITRFLVALKPSEYNDVHVYIDTRPICSGPPLYDLFVAAAS